MLNALRIDNYRAFRALEVASLAPVNLFVGANNVGKTALLDAVDLFAYRDSPEALWRASERRRELTSFDPGGESAAWEGVDFDLSLLVYGRVVREGVLFSVEGFSDHTPAFVRGCVTRPKDNGLVFVVESDLRERSEIPITPHGRIVETAHRFRDRSGPTWHRELIEPDLPEARFISTWRDDLRDVAASWEQVVLTPDEQPILAALQILEPDLERVAFVSSNVPGSHGPGFVVKLRGSDRRLPLGSLGDGMRRMLTIALHLVRARGGFLLVDEIDAGIHHSAMVSLWRLVIETARRLGVQVFATTHSYDCVYALANLCEESAGLAADVAVHRIERGNPRAVRYAASEIGVAARHHLEVR